MNSFFKNIISQKGQKKYVKIFSFGDYLISSSLCGVDVRMPTLSSGTYRKRRLRPNRRSRPSKFLFFRAHRQDSVLHCGGEVMAHSQQIFYCAILWSSLLSSFPFLSQIQKNNFYILLLLLLLLLSRTALEQNAQSLVVASLYNTLDYYYYYY